MPLALYLSSFAFIFHVYFHCFYYYVEVLEYLLFSTAAEDCFHFLMDLLLLFIFQRSAKFLNVLFDVIIQSLICPLHLDLDGCKIPGDFC